MLVDATHRTNWWSPLLAVPAGSCKVMPSALLFMCCCTLGFPGGSDGKESTCNAGDLGLIPWFGWEDCLEEGMATHSSIPAGRVPMDRGAWWVTVYGVTKSRIQLSD